jgi:hypothetical protein
VNPPDIRADRLAEHNKKSCDRSIISGILREAISGRETRRRKATGIGVIHPVDIHAKFMQSLCYDISGEAIRAIVDELDPPASRASIAMPLP